MPTLLIGLDPGDGGGGAVGLIGLARCDSIDRFLGGTTIGGGVGCGRSEAKARGARALSPISSALETDRLRLTTRDGGAVVPGVELMDWSELPDSLRERAIVVGLKDAEGAGGGGMEGEAIRNESIASASRSEILRIESAEGEGRPEVVEDGRRIAGESVGGPGRAPGGGVSTRVDWARCDDESDEESPRPRPVTGGEGVVLYSGVSDSVRGPSDGLGDRSGRAARECLRCRCRFESSKCARAYYTVRTSQNGEAKRSGMGHTSSSAFRPAKLQRGTPKHLRE